MNAPHCLNLFLIVITTTYASSRGVSAESNSTAIALNSTINSTETALNSTTTKLSKKSGYDLYPDNSELQATTGVGWGGFYGYPSRFAGYPVTGIFPTLKPGYGYLDFYNYGLGYYSPHYTGYVNQGYGTTSGYRPYTGGYGGAYGGGHGGGGYGGSGGYGGYDARAGLPAAETAGAGRFSNGYGFTEKLQSRSSLAGLPRSPKSLPRLGDTSSGGLVAEDGAPAQGITGSAYGVSYGQEQDPSSVAPATATSNLGGRQAGGYGGYSGYNARAGLPAAGAAGAGRFSNGYGFTETTQSRSRFAGLPQSPLPRLRDTGGGLVAENGAPAQGITGSAYGVPYGQEQDPSSSAPGTPTLASRQAGAYGGYSGYDARAGLPAAEAVDAGKFGNEYGFTEKLQSRSRFASLPRSPLSRLGDTSSGGLVAADEARAQGITGSAYGVPYAQEQDVSSVAPATSNLASRQAGVYGGYGGYGVGGVAGRAPGDANGYLGLSAQGYSGYPGQYGGAMGLGAYGGYPVGGVYGGYGGAGVGGLLGRKASNAGEPLALNSRANGGMLARDGSAQGLVPDVSPTVNDAAGSTLSHGAYGGAGWGGYGGGGYGGTETGNPGYGARYPGYKTSYGWGFGGPTKAYTTYS